jgi:hypothetical protein
MDQVSQMIKQGDPESLYHQAALFDRVHEAFQGIEDKFRKQGLEFGSSWTGGSADAYGTHAKDVTGVLDLVRQSPHYASLLRRSGDVLADGQRRIRDLEMQRAQEPGAPPGQYDEQARQILRDVSTAYEDVGARVAGGTEYAIDGIGRPGPPPAPAPFAGAATYAPPAVNAPAPSPGPVASAAPGGSGRAAGVWFKAKPSNWPAPVDGGFVLGKPQPGVQTEIQPDGRTTFQPGMFGARNTVFTRAVAPDTLAPVAEAMPDTPPEGWLPAGRGGASPAIGRAELARIDVADLTPRWQPQIENGVVRPGSGPVATSQDTERRPVAAGLETSVKQTVSSTLASPLVSAPQETPTAATVPVTPVTASPGPAVSTAQSTPAAPEVPANEPSVSHAVQAASAAPSAAAPSTPSAPAGPKVPAADVSPSSPPPRGTSAPSVPADPAGPGVRSAPADPAVSPGPTTSTVARNATQVFDQPMPVSPSGGSAGTPDARGPGGSGFDTAQNGTAAPSVPAPRGGRGPAQPIVDSPVEATLNGSATNGAAGRVVSPVGTAAGEGSSGGMSPMGMGSMAPPMAGSGGIHQRGSGVSAYLVAERDDWGPADFPPAVLGRPVRVPEPPPSRPENPFLEGILEGIKL